MVKAWRKLKFIAYMLIIFASVLMIKNYVALLLFGKVYPIPVVASYSFASMGFIILLSVWLIERKIKRLERQDRDT